MVARIALLILLLAFVNGCATQGSFCDLATPKRLTPEQIDQLTDEQVKDILGHNRRGAAFCDWEP